MNNAVQKVRLVVMGAPKVGISALVKRLLYNTFEEKYKPTVEQLYSKEYEVGRQTIQLDILDTAGDLQFPAMRRLSIATAHAFLLAYAVDDISSFETIKNSFHEIQDERQDIQDIPIVIAGNKSDVNPNNVVVEFDDMADWITKNFSDIRVKIIECSAKQNCNIQQLFSCYLKLSRPENSVHNVSSCGGTAQRYSTSARSPAASDFLCLPNLSASSTSLNTRFLSVEDKSSASRKNKPRSKSLVRRCSRRMNKQAKEATDEPGECKTM